MKVPGTYSDWMECFDILKEGGRDSEVLECTRKGKLTLSAGVAGRFATQLNNVIQYRFKKASDKFDRAMQINNGDPNSLSSSLLMLRREISFLVQFANLPVLTPEDVKLLIDAIKNQAATMQQSLESSAKRMDRTGMLASIIKKNRIDKLEGL